MTFGAADDWRWLTIREAMLGTGIAVIGSLGDAIPNNAHRVDALRTSPISTSSKHDRKARFAEAWPVVKGTLGGA